MNVCSLGMSRHFLSSVQSVNTGRIFAPAELVREIKLIVVPFSRVVLLSSLVGGDDDILTGDRKCAFLSSVMNEFSVSVLKFASMELIAVMRAGFSRGLFTSICS